MPKIPSAPPIDPTPRRSFDNIVEEWMTESPKMFTEATAVSSLEKAFDEMKELNMAMSHGDGPEVIAEEYADVLACIFNSAALRGFTAGEIIEAFDKKMEINYKRTWIKQDNNTYQHKT